MDNPYDWLQRFVADLPDLLQPLIIAAAATVPYIEGEGAAALGIIAGVHPLVAAPAAAAGNFVCVIGVVLLSSRLRERVVARRSRTGASALPEDRAGTPSPGPSSGDQTGGAAATASKVGLMDGPEDEPRSKPSRRDKGRARLRRWMVRFGVPGTSILAPLALPTMLTAAFFVGSGVPRRWVILWQGVAISLWTGAVAVAATGAVAALGW